MQKKKKNKSHQKLLRIIIYLIFLIIIFNIAPNYEKDDSYYVENKLNIIFDNNNITENLKRDLFINNKNVIYMSIEDVEVYFDNSIKYDEDNNQIITTYGEKTVKLPLNRNTIVINGREQAVISGALEKDGIYYIPLTVMEKIYELDLEHVKEEQIVLLDSLIKKLIKADISKNCSVKYKTTSYSRTVDKLKRGDKVIVIEHLENNWTKIRTKNGKIGYIKTSILQNEIYVREDFNI